MKLFCSCFCSSQGIGQGHSQVVVAVHADWNLYSFLQLAYHVIGRARIHYTYGIGDADVVGMVLFGFAVKLL